MQWQIGLAGDCLFSGGRLGNGSRLRFGKRFPWDFLADEPCADIARRRQLRRKVCCTDSTSSEKKRSNCPADCCCYAGGRIQGYANNVLQLGKRSIDSSFKRIPNTLKGFKSAVSKALVTTRIELFLFFGNRPIPITWECRYLGTVASGEVQETNMTSAS